jgi:hypothetical protein
MNRFRESRGYREWTAPSRLTRAELDDLIEAAADRGVRKALASVGLMSWFWPRGLCVCEGFAIVFVFQIDGGCTALTVRTARERRA